MPDLNEPRYYLNAYDPKRPFLVGIHDVGDDDEPSVEQLQEWMDEGVCETTDGCVVEPDGTCEHGKKSWALVMGLI